MLYAKFVNRIHDVDWYDCRWRRCFEKGLCAIPWIISTLAEKKVTMGSKRSRVSRNHVMHDHVSLFSQDLVDFLRFFFELPFFVARFCCFMYTNSQAPKGKGKRYLIFAGTTTEPSGRKSGENKKKCNWKENA